MHYIARVTIQGDPNGLHARPTAWIADKIRGLDASIVFQRDGVSVPIQPEFPMLDIMQAAAILKLACGTTFEVICDGKQAREALAALRDGFTTRYFEGSSFTDLDERAEDRS